MINREFKIGCHLSFAKGYEQMGKDALSIDANAFQYFSRNPRGGKSKAFDSGDCKKLCKIATENDFAAYLVHAPYTYNPCSDKEDLRIFATTAMREDLERQELVEYPSLYNFHPGSHLKQGVQKGVELISQLLNNVMFESMTTTVLLETMSGKGSEIGVNFQEIADIISMSKFDKKLGVCLDTCHVYSAGYDIVNNLDSVLDEFDKIVGLNRLKAIHLNDSMMPFNSHKDRHAKISEGTIGLDATIALINNPRLKSVPFYLETPNELDGYAKEIALLRNAKK